MSKRFETAQDLEAILDAVVAKNIGTSTGGCDAHRIHTPLDAMIASEVESGVDSDGVRENDDAMVNRQEIFRGLLDYFFADGINPLDVIRRVYAVAKAVAPELLNDMSLEDMAILCADGGRATPSARIKRVYNRYIEERGGGKRHAHFQKAPETVKKYAAAQKGNHNRKKSVRRKLRKK